MNCDEIQRQLSEYLDKSLDVITARTIENHLASCSRCAMEAYAVTECIQQVKALAPVDPPLGFSRRIMARVRELDARSGWWARLWFPMRVKLPLHATAAVLVGALAIIVAQREQPKDRQVSDQVSSGATASPESKTADQSTLQAPSLPTASIRSPIDTRAEPAKARVEPNSSFASTASGNVEAQPNGGLADDEKAAKNTPRRPPIKVQEVAVDGLARSSDPFGFGPSAGALRQQGRPLGASDRFLSPLSDPSADVEFIVRRRPRQRPDQQDASAVATSGQPSALPEPAAPPLAQNASVVEIRWFTVPAQQFEQFKKELAAEARIESERSHLHTAGNTGRDLLVKVLILSPTDR